MFEYYYVFLASLPDAVGSLILQRLFQACRDGASGSSCTYVPALPVLFDETILENICFGNPFEEKKFREAVERANLAEDIAGFPEGIGKQAGRMGGSLSGGQRKRIALARALYGGGEIFFLDGLSDDIDKKTEKALAAGLLNDPERIIFVASDSQEIRRRAGKIYEAKVWL